MSSVRDFWMTKILPHVPYAIRHDFWRKLFALVFAVILTVYAHLNTTQKKGDSKPVSIDFGHVKVQFVADNNAFTLVKRTPEDTDVLVRMKISGGTDELKSDDFYIECPVTQSEIDRNGAKELAPDMVKCRKDIDFIVDEIYPEAITLDAVDYVAEKTVPVRIDYDPQEVMAGYRVTSVQTEKQVVIRGLKGEIGGVSELRTEKLPLSDVSNSFSRMVRLIPPDGNGERVKLLSDAVRVEVKIEKSQSITFDGLPLQVIFDKVGANSLAITKIQPETVSVQVEGLSSIPAAEMERQIHPVLNLSDLKTPGVYTIDRIRCLTDNDDIKVLRVTPSQVTVTLEPVAPPSN